MTFYVQEKVEYNAQLCLMNMAVHGFIEIIKSGGEANTFYRGAHNLNGKCNYVMANPPFNVDKVKHSPVKVRNVCLLACQVSIKVKKSETETICDFLFLQLLK